MRNLKNRKKYFSKVLIIIAVTGLFFTACTTIKPAGDSEALYIIELINSGNAESLTSLSADSFLLDSEILHGSTLTATFWNRLAGAGFTLEDAVITERRAPVPADADIFGAGSGVRAFFSRYIPAGSSLFRISSGSKGIVMILSPDGDGNIMITAFGGPF